MKQELANYLNAETEKLKAKQREEKPSWSNEKANRMLELEEKNSFGDEPRLTHEETIELQNLLDENYGFVGQ